MSRYGTYKDRHTFSVEVYAIFFLAEARDLTIRVFSFSFFLLRNDKCIVAFFRHQNFAQRSILSSALACVA